MRRVPYGQRGTPVYTHLERTSQPMIRLVSGDLTLWTNEPNPCGRTYPRLPQGIFGRIDDMFTIRGENVYPSEIDAALNELPGYGGEHRIVITPRGRDGRVAAAGRGGRRDRSATGAARSKLPRRGRAQASRRCWACARWSRSSRPASIPRTDFKARRVIDDREVFREMHAQIERSGDVMSRYVPSLAADRPGRRPASAAAIARLISRAEAGIAEGARGARRRSTGSPGKAHVVGITGVPGSGKSTLVGEARREAPRQPARKVGIVAIDPSSPYSGGAILGDRIRMTRHRPTIPASTSAAWRRAARPAAWRAPRSTRSISSMSRAIDTIIIETVGVGQDEVEIARASHTTVVVSAPGLGDEIQAIKAGILEIADIHVVVEMRPAATPTARIDRSEADADARPARRPKAGVAAAGDRHELRSRRGPRRAARGASTRHRDALRRAEARPSAPPSTIAEFRLLQDDRGAPAASAFARASADGRVAARRDARRRAKLDPYSLASELCSTTVREERAMNKTLDPKTACRSSQSEVDDWEKQRGRRRS